MEKIKSLVAIIFKIMFVLILATILFASVRGLPGNPTAKDLINPEWREDGPLELSPERGRFALLYSIIEDKSFYFSLDVAKFVVPDLGYKNGNYVSLFAPGVSYAAIPGYLVGKMFNASQVGAFTSIAIFALINAYLIKKLSHRLGANKVASNLAALIFLFATPAFTYATTLYQHHISTFLILISLLLLDRYKSFTSLALIWFFCALSIPVDYPNLFIMFPIGVAALSKIAQVENKGKRIIATFKTLYFASFLTLLMPLGFFMWFNQASYGNPLQFSGTVGSVRAIDNNGKPTSATVVSAEDQAWYSNPDNQKKSAVNFFKSRYILNGVNIHLISPDRGVAKYSPIMILGLVVIFVLYKSNKRQLSLLMGVIGINLFLYSMWGDPWGGWAFGSRYLIPSYAIISILLGLALTKYNNKWWFIVPAWLLLIYSICINSLGALTTSAIPPLGEAKALEPISGRQERYSYDRNWEFLNNQGSKSFVYNTWGYKYVNPVEYFYIIAGSIAVVATALTTGVVLSKNDKKQN